ncbi:MAG: sugar phosphate isomerase/epimerase, partial [Pirellulaceae bacterium]|nr:sugar phosphate isomerase/epimerase [Pirellulaceae bacterium]
MFVSASTECFLDRPLSQALDRLADLEYTSVELALFEDANHLKPSQIAADLEAAMQVCRNTRRLDIAAFDVRITATGPEHYDQ